MNNQKELIPMRPGDLLRFKREQAGLTLDRASELSRIKPSVLAAIESGETAAIPAVYLRGYIRNYARALGIDGAEVEAHMDQVQGAEPAVQSVFTVPAIRGRSERWLKASSYLAASAIIAALAWQFTHEAVRFSQGDSQLAAGTAVGRDAAESGGGETAVQPRSANTHLNASIAAVEVMPQRPDRGGAAAEQAWAAIAGQSEAAPPVTGQHHLILNTSADSWVEIVDGQGDKLEMDLVRAGSQREYSGTGPFRIMVGRASAVGLSLDGEAIDLAPHTRGNVARLTLLDTLAADSGEQPADSERR